MYNTFYEVFIFTYPQRL